jgi:hypothetical protein
MLRDGWDRIVQLTYTIHVIRACRIAFRLVTCPTARPFGRTTRSARNVSRMFRPSLSTLISNGPASCVPEVVWRELGEFGILES